MTKLFGGLLGAGTLAAVCSIAACTVSSTSDVSGSGSDGGKTDGSSSSDGGSSGDGATTTDGGGDGGGTCKLKVSVGDTACDNCATTNCCEKVNACADNAECAALDTCLGACLDVDGGGDAGAITDCENACYGVHPTGKDAFDAVTSCIQSSCSSTCK